MEGKGNDLARLGATSHSFLFLLALLSSLLCAPSEIKHESQRRRPPTKNKCQPISICRMRSSFAISSLSSQVHNSHISSPISPSCPKHLVVHPQNPSPAANTPKDILAVSASTFVHSPPQHNSPTLATTASPSVPRSPVN